MWAYSLTASTAPTRGKPCSASIVSADGLVAAATLSPIPSETMPVSRSPIPGGAWTVYTGLRRLCRCVRSVDMAVNWNLAPNFSQTSSCASTRSLSRPYPGGYSAAGSLSRGSPVPCAHSRTNLSMAAFRSCMAPAKDGFAATKRASAAIRPSRKSGFLTNLNAGLRLSTSTLTAPSSNPTLYMPPPASENRTSTGTLPGMRALWIPSSTAAAASALILVSRRPGPAVPPKYPKIDSAEAPAGLPALSAWSISLRRADFANASRAARYSGLSSIKALLLKLTGTKSRLSCPVILAFSGCAGNPNFSCALISLPCFVRCMP